jgi:hypothetical protein
MGFIKKHYEKVLLGVVLVGLLVAFGFLPIKINSEKEKLDALRTSLTNPKVKALSNYDLTLPQQTLQRMTVPAVVDFSTSNKVFNPMTWQQSRDGHLLRLDKAGPVAAVVTNVTPLYLILTFESASVTADGTANYTIGIEKQAAATTAKRRKTGVLTQLNDRHKNDTFALTAVNGPPENPTSLTVTLNDTGEAVVLTKDKPYKRIDGYMASLFYAPEKKPWKDRRVGDSLIFNGEDYNIVAITQNEVVLSAKSNQKKWTIKFSPPPS